MFRKRICVVNCWASDIKSINRKSFVPDHAFASPKKKLVQSERYIYFLWQPILSLFLLFHLRVYLLGLIEANCYVKFVYFQACSAEENWRKIVCLIILYTLLLFVRSFNCSYTWWNKKCFNWEQLLDCCATSSITKI